MNHDEAKKQEQRERLERQRLQEQAEASERVREIIKANNHITRAKDDAKPPPED
jgi:hypothetical protein